MSFDSSSQLTFRVILVILVIIVIIVTKVIMALMLKVVIKDRCVFKKWLLLDSHRALSRIELLRSQEKGIPRIPKRMLFTSALHHAQHCHLTL